MAFTLDFSKANDGNIKDGTYEAVIFNVLEDATPGGAEYINFDLIVRNDVQQQYQNAHIFHRVWRSKQTHQYNAGMINAIAQAANLSDGKSYNSLEELMQDFLDHPVKVTVKNETSEYKNKTYDNLNVKRWAKSDYPNVQHQYKKARPQQQGQPAQPFNNNGGQTDISDDDMPF